MVAWGAVDIDISQIIFTYVNYIYNYILEVEEAGPGEGLHISFGGNEGVWNESQMTLINEVSNITDFTEHYRCK